MGREPLPQVFFIHICLWNALTKRSKTRASAVCESRRGLEAPQVDA